MTNGYRPVDHDPVLCIYCQQPFKPKNKRRKYCYTTACHSEHRRVENQEYMAKYRAEHGHHPTQKYRPAGAARPPRKIHTNTCVQCSSKYQTKNPRTRFCSNQCAVESRAPGTDIVLYRKPRVHIPQHTKGRGFTSGPCRECGTQFVGAGHNAVYCSSLCDSRAAWSRRRAKLGMKSRQEWARLSRACQYCGDAFRSEIPAAITCTPQCKRKLDNQRGRIGDWITSARRRRIYERDGYTCHLCGELTDAESHFLNDWHPTLDHLVPVSLGGTHEDENIRTCHRWCNSIRGVSGVEEMRVLLGVSLEA